MKDWIFIDQTLILIYGALLLVGYCGTMFSVVLLPPRFSRPFYNLFPLAFFFMLFIVTLCLMIGDLTSN
jgi:hypothetical protein